MVYVYSVKRNLCLKSRGITRSNKPDTILYTQVSPNYYNNYYLCLRLNALTFVLLLKSLLC